MKRLIDRILEITNTPEWFDSPCAREIQRAIEESQAKPGSMDTGLLSNEIRARASRLRHFEPSTQGQLVDDGELLVVLARIVEGMPVERAFGRPGDWGYEHPIGRALAGKGRTR
jgi:hypothetical protein